MDLCSVEHARLLPGEIKLVATGLAIELPSGYEAQIRPRSGLALKYGITLPNSPGTIDPSYRGEIRVIMQNLGHEPFDIEPGERGTKRWSGKKPGKRRICLNRRAARADSDRPGAEKIRIYSVHNESQRLYSGFERGVPGACRQGSGAVADGVVCGSLGGAQQHQAGPDRSLDSRG